MSRTLIVMSLLGSLAVATSAPAEIQNREGYFMNEAEEIRLARTAGPESVSAEASVHVLRDTGFELVERGTNGFHCFVERSWAAPRPDNSILFNPVVRAPNCINAEGARTVMRERFLIAKLALEGHDSAEINRRVDAARAAGELEDPTGVALTYMMSKHQKIGPNLDAWKPHVMLWSPGLTRDEVVGGNDTFLAGKPGSHRACLVVAVENFTG